MCARSDSAAPTARANATTRRTTRCAYYRTANAGTTDYCADHSADGCAHAATAYAGSTHTRTADSSACRRAYHCAAYDSAASAGCRAWTLREQYQAIAGAARVQPKHLFHANLRQLDQCRYDFQLESLYLASRHRDQERW